MRVVDVCQASFCALSATQHARRANPGDQVTVFPLEYNIYRGKWRVYFSNLTTGAGFHAWWKLCNSHAKDIQEDFERLGRDEVNEYNAWVAYIDRGGR